MARRVWLVFVTWLLVGVATGVGCGGSGGGGSGTGGSAATGALGGSGGAGTGGLAGAGGIPSLTRFVGTPVQKSTAYASGNSLTVDGVYGDITIKQGATSDLAVTFEPFAYAPASDEALAKQQIEQNLTFEVSPGPDIVVSVVRTAGSSNGVGAKILVELPAAFDSALSVRNKGEGSVNPGNLAALYVALASSVKLVNEASVGDCSLAGSASVKTTTIFCAAPVSALGVADNVDITVGGLSAGTDPAVKLAIASISSAASGGSVRTEDGAIEAVFPSAGGFTIQALTPVEGVVNVVSPPAGCSVQEAVPGSKTITCGAAAPLYKLTAGEDGLGPSDISVSFK